MPKKRKPRYWLIALLTFAIGAGTGYLLGRYIQRPCINMLVSEIPDTAT